jgi:hypothetical protein
MLSHRKFSIALLIVVPLILSAQEPAPSLADAAKKSSGTTRAKLVIDDDNLRVTRGPIPDMNIEGVDNSDEIIKAIDTFRRSHSASETEQTIRSWYDRYDLLFQHAFDENTEIKARRQDRAADLQKYPDDWKKLQERRSTEIHSELQDQRSVQKNGLLMARIQQTVQRVRTAMQGYGLKYEWMKIRFGNGNGSW